MLTNFSQFFPIPSLLSDYRRGSPRRIHGLLPLADRDVELAQTEENNFLAAGYICLDSYYDLSSNYSLLAALVLSSFLQLSVAEQQKVKPCILISPWIDPLATGGSIDSNGHNDVGDRDFVVACHDLYM